MSERVRIKSKLKEAGVVISSNQLDFFVYFFMNVTKYQWQKLDLFIDFENDILFNEFLEFVKICLKSSKIIEELERNDD